MSKYKWLMLGLIVSIILFLLLLINPLTNFINKASIYYKYVASTDVLIDFPNTIIVPLDKYIQGSIEKSRQEILIEVQEERLKLKKEKNIALRVFAESFYHWNLFWIPIIIFSVLMANYKKEQGKLL